jgi:hypothetical protein
VADFLITSPLTQGVLEVSSPLFTSALFMTGIAATACCYDATDTYLRHYEDGKGKSSFLKKQKDSLKTIVETCESQIKDNSKARIKPLAHQQYNIEKNVYLKYRCEEEGVGALNAEYAQIKIEEFSRNFILKKALELNLKTPEEIKTISEKSDLENLEKSVIFTQAEKINLLTSSKGSVKIPSPNNVKYPWLSTEFKIPSREERIAG